MRASMADSAACRVNPASERADATSDRAVFNSLSSSRRICFATSAACLADSASALAEATAAVESSANDAAAAFSASNWRLRSSWRSACCSNRTFWSATISAFWLSSEASSEAICTCCFKASSASSSRCRISSGLSRSGEKALKNMGIEGDLQPTHGVWCAPRWMPSEHKRSTQAFPHSTQGERDSQDGQTWQGGAGCEIWMVDVTSVAAAGSEAYCTHTTTTQHQITVSKCTQCTLTLNAVYDCVVNCISRGRALVSDTAWSEGECAGGRGTFGVSRRPLRAGRGVTLRGLRSNAHFSCVATQS